METLRILWYNWRCIKHPLAGGAEVYTHEIAMRLARQGHEIILVSSGAKGLSRKEIIDGYKVIRVGSRYTVYLNARRIYRKLREAGWRPDIVIDEVNTIPFLTPRYVEEPIAMLIHQLCMDCWSYAIHPLIQPFGWWLERRLHKVYIESAKNGSLRAIITVSLSTKNDLIKLGYPEDKISIVYNGLDWDLYKGCGELCKEKDDLVVYIGRITPYKKIEDLIKAWIIIEQVVKKAKLVIAGRAEPKYLDRLVSLAKKHNLKNIEFKTNITQEEKKTLLAKAKILVYTSIREGWGQTIIEAAACGTPSIAYDVPGLRDSVRHMETGILVEPGNIVELANAVRKLMTGDEEWSKLSLKAYEHSKGFSWDNTAREFLKILKSSV